MKWPAAQPIQVCQPHPISGSYVHLPWPVARSMVYFSPHRIWSQALPLWRKIFLHAGFGHGAIKGFLGLFLLWPVSLSVIHPHISSHNLTSNLSTLLNAHCAHLRLHHSKIFLSLIFAKTTDSISTSLFVVSWQAMHSAGRFSSSPRAASPHPPPMACLHNVPHLPPVPEILNTTKDEEDVEVWVWLCSLGIWS